MKKQSGFSLVEGLLLLLVLSVVSFGGYYVVSQKNTNNKTSNSVESKDVVAVSDTSTKSSDAQKLSETKSISIPELGVNINDPEKRGLGVYYGDQSYYNNVCDTNPSYFGDPSTCKDYAGGTYCKEASLNDTNHCYYYVYDNSTRSQESYTISNDGKDTGAYYKFYQCSSSLVIYEVDPNDPIYNNKATKNTDNIKINGRQFELWAHGAAFESGCNDTDANKASDYIADLLLYVKSNLVIK